MWPLPTVRILLFLIFVLLRRYVHQSLLQRNAHGRGDCCCANLSWRWWSLPCILAVMGLQNHLVRLVNIITRWWFQIFYIFTATWGNDPIWLIFFKWVETTNQIIWGWTHPAFTFVQVWGDVLAAVLKRIVGRKSAQDALSQTLGHFDCKHRFFSGFLHVFFCCKITFKIFNLWTQRTKCPHFLQMAP